MADGIRKRRTKGTGSIFKNGEYYYLQYYVEGKKIVKSLRTKNKEEAGRRAKELLPDLVLQTREEVVGKVAALKRLKLQDRVKLTNVWEMFYNSKFRRPNTAEGTLNNYRRNYERFLRWVRANYPAIDTLSEISTAIAEEYARDLEREGQANVTYNYHIGALATITKALMRDAGLLENVWLYIPHKPVESTSKKAFTQDEINKLFAYLEDNSLKLMHKEQMRILFYIGLFTGMRLVDCALLQWKDINMTDDLISLMPVKTKGSRKRITVPISPDFRTKLQEASDAWGGGQYVLPRVAERYKRNLYGVNEDVLKVLNAAGFETTVEAGEGTVRKNRINQYGFHSLRHTFCSHAASNGMSIEMLSDITGDSIPTLQKYYVRIQHQALRDASGTIPSVLMARVHEVSLPANPQDDLLAEIRNAEDLTEREKRLLALLGQRVNPAG